MPKLRSLAAVLAALACAAPAQAAEGPALSVPPQELAAALDCPASLAGAARAPVLLVPGTNTQPQPNFDWNYQRALTAAKVPWCAVTLPRYAMGDLQIAAEYVVHAVRTMRAQAGRRVSIIGWSQGGMLGRWALKWWPDTRAMVEDLVGLAPSNHGTQSARNTCMSSCPPAYWQQRDDSKFIAALNAGAETWEGIDYTVAYTRYDEIVTPNAEEATASSPLRTGAGRIRNVQLQELCPANASDHFPIGSYDAVGWAIAFDAISSAGPVDPVRIDAGVCAQPFMPGVNPATFPADYARFTASIAQGAAQAEYVPAEPPLRCYVTGACAKGAPGSSSTSAGGSSPAAAGSTGRSAGSSCTSRRRFVIRLPKGLRSARVVVGSKRVRVTRRKGRLSAVVDLRGRSRGIVRVTVRGSTRSGRAVRQTRRYRTCT